MTEKLIENGKVAVLVSGGYGAGWSTWMYDYPDCLFDPVIAQMVIDGAEETEIAVVAEKRYPDAYLGGIDGIDVVWIPIGTHFRINEYDGAESIEYLNEVNWYVA